MLFRSDYGTSRQPKYQYGYNDPLITIKVSLAQIYTKRQKEKVTMIIRWMIICLLISGCAMNAHHKNADITYVDPDGLTAIGEYSVVPTTNGVEVTAKFSEYQFIQDFLGGWIGCVNVLNVGAAEYAATQKREVTPKTRRPVPNNPYIWDRPVVPAKNGLISWGRDPFSAVMNVNCRHEYTFKTTL